MTYKQLTPEDRYTISTLKMQGFTLAQIGEAIGKHRSTIYREIARNSCNDGGYRVSKAISRTKQRRSVSRRNLRFTEKDISLVIKYLKMKWSPMQISWSLYYSGELSISHETIYQHIWIDRADGGDLYTHLRQSQKLRRKRYRRYDSRGVLANKRSIKDRPKYIDKKKRIGDFEIDTVMGSGDQHCIATVIERKTGYSYIGKLKNRTKEEMNKYLIKLIKSSDGKIKTITADNGTEFHGYKEVEKETGVKFYFAAPYHSWERGLNENTNGLIRQYLPKRKSMAFLTQRDCNKIAYDLNTRPRERLDFRTPLELYEAA